MIKPMRSSVMGKKGDNHGWKWGTGEADAMVVKELYPAFE
jgi:hypothetical protein